MGTPNFFLTRVTTDDFATSTTAEEESIALAIAALQSMPETPWRNRENHQQSSNGSGSSSSSSKRPRSATQAAMKTKCPTRTSLLSWVPPKLAHRQSASTTHKKAKHSMSRPRPLQEPTAVLASTHKSAAWKNVLAPMTEAAVRVDPRQQPTTAAGGNNVVPSPRPVPAPLDSMLLPSYTVVPSLSSHPESRQPTRPPQQQHPSCSAPPCYYESEERQQQQQHYEQHEDSTEENDDNHHNPPHPTDHSPTTRTRLARCRERNREHARKTRLRKKAALQELQTRIRLLQQTKACLQQRVQEQSIASILLGLTSTTTVDPAAGTVEDPSVGHANRINDSNETDAATPLWDPQSAATAAMLKAEGQEHRCKATDAATTTGINKRQRSHIVPHSPLQVRIAGKGMVTIQSQINWKTGTYMDDAGVTQQLNVEELELLRRERNRRHAKMTRDRKRSFLMSMEITVEELERDIALLCRHQNNNNNDSNNNKITPLTSPEMEPEPAPHHPHGFLISLIPTSHDNASNIMT